MPTGVYLHQSRNVAERFWEKVEVHTAMECWPWKAVRNVKGYGHFQLNGTMPSAHRIAYELTRGPIPEGLFVCHHCDNPSCVNPAHLFLGTNSDNMYDMIRKGRARPACGERNGTHTHPESYIGMNRGESNGSSKLTMQQAQEIRIQYANGEHQRKLATEYGVCQATISHIVQRKNWVSV